MSDVNGESFKAQISEKFNVVPSANIAGRYVIVYRQTGAVADDADGHGYTSPAAAWKSLYHKVNEHEITLTDTKSPDAFRLERISNYKEHKKAVDQEAKHNINKQFRTLMPRIERALVTLDAAITAGVVSANRYYARSVGNYSTIHFIPSNGDAGAFLVMTNTSMTQSLESDIPCGVSVDAKGAKFVSFDHTTGERAVLKNLHVCVAQRCTNAFMKVYDEWEKTVLSEIDAELDRVYGKSSETGPEGTSL